MTTMASVTRIVLLTQVLVVVVGVVRYVNADNDSLNIKNVKRSDDSNPLEAVVEHLTQQVAQLQAQVQANRNDIDAANRQMVGFTVRMKNADMRGLGLDQVIRWDNVLFNAGGGYDPSSGTFTAVLPGTYVFFLQALRHAEDQQKVFLDVIKNGSFLTRAHAGFSPYESGSTLAVTHLNQGDTIRVQISVGSMFWGGDYSTFSGFRVSPH